jgi:molecular chaperone GrpE
MTKEKKEALTPDSAEEKKAAEETAGKQEVPAAGPVTLSKADYDLLLQKIKNAEALEDRMLRSAADFENAKKRLLKEKEEFSQFVLESFFYDLLSVLDNVERALAHKGESQTASEKSIWNGIELIQKQWNEVLKSRGLARMEVLHKPFDPHIHEAVAQVESQTEPESTIAEEVLAGYLLHGKVLRPAKVKVYTKEKKSDSEKTEEIT